MIDLQAEAVEFMKRVTTDDYYWKLQSDRKGFNLVIKSNNKPVNSISMEIAKAITKAALVREKKALLGIAEGLVENHKMGYSMGDLENDHYLYAEDLKQQLRELKKL